MNELEDLYLPYKQKRKTRASVAREKGLEPLAKLIMEQREKDILLKAERFTNEQVKDVEDALQGARDIISEWLSEDLKIRNIIRQMFQREARIHCQDH